MPSALWMNGALNYFAYIDVAKCIIMDVYYHVKDPVAGSVSVLNLTEVFMQKPDSSSFGMATCDYFRALCQQSFPGPLVGGNVGSKELNKWIDERIAHCDSPDMEYRKGKVLRLLISLLKIGCQHYGKLRSPFGTDTLSKVLHVHVF